MPEDSVIQNMVRLIRVFIASPGDVFEERERAGAVIQRVNKRHAIEQGILLDTWRWELDAVPGLGRPQEVINPSLDEAAIVVLVLWNRMGSPSTKAESGTVEEFERAFERYRKTGWPRVMVYYCNRPASLDTADQLEQRSRVLEFKKKHEQDFLSAKPYTTPDEFEDMLETHLDKMVDEIAALSVRRAVRKVLYVNVTGLRDRRVAGALPLYTREVDRLPAESRDIAVFDEAVYFTLEMFPEGRQLTPRVDRSGGAVDPRMVVPFRKVLKPSDPEADAIPQTFSYEVGEKVDTLLTVSHFLNGLQGDEQYIASRVTDDVEYIRMVVDFSSVPGAAQLVQPGKAVQVTPAGERDLEVVQYGPSIYTILCEGAKQGDLLKFFVRFNWPRAK